MGKVCSRNRPTVHGPLVPFWLARGPVLGQVHQLSRFRGARDLLHDHVVASVFDAASEVPSPSCLLRGFGASPWGPCLVALGRVYEQAGQCPQRALVALHPPGSQGQTPGWVLLTTVLMEAGRCVAAEAGLGLPAPRRRHRWIAALSREMARASVPLARCWARGQRSESVARTAVVPSYTRPQTGVSQLSVILGMFEGLM